MSVDSSQESSAADRHRFIQNCVFVGLHTSTSIEAFEFLGRHEETWLQLFSDLLNERTSRPLKDPEEEIHLASLLWGLLDSAENRGSSLYCLESKSFHSAQENLWMLANLMGVGGNSQPSHFGEIDQNKANRILSRCKMFEHPREIHVASLTEQICRYVPLAGKVRLPAGLPRTIRDETAKIIWREM